jgi:hypothetical protein
MAELLGDEDSLTSTLQRLRDARQQELAKQQQEQLAQQQQEQLRQQQEATLLQQVLKMFNHLSASLRAVMAQVNAELRPSN